MCSIGSCFLGIGLLGGHVGNPHHSTWNLTFGKRSFRKMVQTMNPRTVKRGEHPCPPYEKGGRAPYDKGGRVCMPPPP